MATRKVVLAAVLASIVACSRNDPKESPITAATETAAPSVTAPAPTPDDTATSAPAPSTSASIDNEKPPHAPPGIPGECINMAPNAPIPEVCKHLK